MFDFSEEFTIDSYRIPWLIWIQILVMFLLIFLLYSFTIFSSDLSENHAVTRSPSSASSLDKDDLKAQKRRLKNSATISNCLQVGGSESIKGEIATSTSRRIRRGEDSIERQGSSSKDVTRNHISHPCNYFRLARVAFLKCLGLDNTPENSFNNERKKDN